ncbi:hypothetical protein B0H63DRAFT_493305 [Podospora didyma]|uniref:Uncharacterized protein n=1 Tax=Podospora didyma TaxID=330526 RepID=A0AAE0U0L0_9PEZI|nr:hypothetical protein B0H63DRAFT_493305 [Podospora didyma]
MPRTDFQYVHISILATKHNTEPRKRLSVGDLRDVFRYGDDSHLPPYPPHPPGLFFYAQGMPVVVTRNQLNIALASDVTLHLAPPTGILLQSDDIADFAMPGLLKGTVLINSKTVAIPDSMRGKGPRSRGKSAFGGVTHRTGPLCTPAFAMTDQKSQGKLFALVLLNLKGVYGSSAATKPSFMSLYGLYLFRKPARADFIEPKNVLGKGMRDAVLRLERIGEETRRRFERDYRLGIRDWDAMPETTEGGDAADEEDTSLWCYP